MKSMLDIILRNQRISFFPQKLAALYAVMLAVASKVYAEVQDCEVGNYAQGKWKLQMLLAGVLGMALWAIFPYAAFAAVIDNLPEIPVGQGQACIRYSTGYIALLDWRGRPADMGTYYLISYDSVDYFETVNSCVGGACCPGTLQTGNFYLLIGGLISQAAIVKIEYVGGQCPYMLTYYWLKNPVRVPYSDGTCTINSPPDTNKNLGSFTTCQ